MAVKAVRSNRVMALSPVAMAVRGRYVWQVESSGGGGNVYSRINLPSSFDWFSPYNVYADNTTTYDPRLFKPTSGKIYYCKPASQGGSDAADGLTWETAVATPSVAMQKSDCVRALLAAGRYPKAFWGDTTPQANFRAMICEDGIAEFLASNLDDSANFAPDPANPGAYKWIGGASGVTVYNVLDENNLDRFLCWRRLTRVADAATCAATPNSVAVVGTDIYVRMFDGRAPDANLRINTQRRAWPGRSGVDQYFEGIAWHGAAVLWGGNWDAEARVHCYRCKAGYSHANQGNANFATTMSVFSGYKDCESYSPDLDCFSYRSASRGIEVGCRAYNAPLSGSNNATTAHDGSSSVSIGGRYYQTVGRVAASVSNQPWAMIGCLVRDSIGASGSDYNSAAEVVLINCSNEGTKSQFGGDGAGAKRVKNTTITKGVISSPIVVDESLYNGPGVLPVMPPDPTNSGAVTLTVLVVGIPTVITAAQLLANSSNALHIIGLTATNATVSSVKTTGPWTVTPTSSGTVTLSYTVCGEMGRTVTQTANATVVAA